MAQYFKGKHYAAHLNFDRLAESKLEAGKRGLAQAAIWLTGEYKRILSLPGPFSGGFTGIARKRQLERIAKAGETERASLPGEPPRRRTGILRASVINESTEGGLVQRVGSPLEYAFWLEFGTVNMEPRPWLRPGLRMNAERLGDIVLAAMRD